MTIYRYISGPDLWEHMVPTWEGPGDWILTPDVNSNPIIYYIKWMIATGRNPFGGVILNDAYTDGFSKCPWEMDQWKYYNYEESQCYEDPTFIITCNK